MHSIKQKKMEEIWLNTTKITEENKTVQRRDFLKLSVVASASLLAPPLSAYSINKPRDNQKISRIAFPEKKPLITYSNRPPLLETPRGSFVNAITPNDEFFVRWHMPSIPTHKYISTYRISVNGDVENPLLLSLQDLKENYEQVEITAVCQCGGNSRSAFSPTTVGIQWGSGAMGCATWKGVRLRDILKSAKPHKDASWLGLNGDDKPIMDKMPSYARELKIDEIADNVIVAYEMNGQDLPYLNGYPVRLVIPGTFSDSWVKMLSNITVSKKYKKIFYMDEAYRIADNKCECEQPDNLATKTKPITSMNIKSYIGFPNNNAKIKRNSSLISKGVAFDEGDGIKEVFISTDDGKSWQKANLGKELSPYAFRVFSFKIDTSKIGKLNIMAKAVNNKGVEQPFAKDIKWNRGGYKYNGIDSVSIAVV